MVCAAGKHVVKTPNTGMGQGGWREPGQASCFRAHTQLAKMKLLVRLVKAGK